MISGSQSRLVHQVLFWRLRYDQVGSWAVQQPVIPEKYDLNISQCILDYTDVYYSTMFWMIIEVCTLIGRAQYIIDVIPLITHMSIAYQVRTYRGGAGCTFILLKRIEIGPQNTLLHIFLI